MNSPTPDPRDRAAPAPTSTHRLLMRLLREHVRPYLGRLALAAGCMMVMAAATGANAWLLKPAIDEVFIAKSTTMLLLVPLAVMGVAVVKALAGYGQSVLMSEVGQRIISDTQVRMYEHLIRADLSYIQDSHTGKLISSFLFDAGLLREAVSRAVTGMVKDLLTFIALLVVMFIQDWKLALITMFVLPTASVVIRMLGRRARKASTRTQEETGKLSTHLSETLEGARLVKAYGMEAYESGRARQAVDRRLREMMKVVRARAAAVPTTEALGSIAIATAIFYGGWQAHAGNLTLGAFMSFLAALLMAYQPIRSLASLNTAMQEGLAAAQRVFALLDVEPAIKDRPDARPLSLAGGAVTFEKVAFRYPDGKPALRGIDLAVPAGRTVALVGPSGGGKSTLLNLLLRFYDPSEGAISIDGQDLRDVSMASLRGAIALVSQEITLFDDTVRANIAYGRPGASEADIVAAAKAAAAHEFITALPQGYDTYVGEKGVRLSGGQRQRISIARAMLRDAPILLLDEATSALDSDSERQVQEALRVLVRGRTTLVIAHRLSTVIAADRIHVMEGGRIVESGTHDDLLAQGGLYARLYAPELTAQAPVRKVAQIGG